MGVEMKRAADEFDFIAQRVRELEAEREAVRNIQPVEDWAENINRNMPKDIFEQTGSPYIG